MAAMNTVYSEWAASALGKSAKEAANAASRTKLQAYISENGLDEAAAAAAAAAAAEGDASAAAAVPSSESGVAEKKAADARRLNENKNNNNNNENEARFLPYTGNGFIGLSLASDQGIYVSHQRSQISLKINYQPVSRIFSTMLSNKEVHLVEFVSGLVSRLQCYEFVRWLLLRMMYLIEWQTSSKNVFLIARRE